MPPNYYVVPQLPGTSAKDRLELAIWFAEHHHIPVFPIDAGRKAPPIYRWPSVATTDPERIRRWLKDRRHFGCNFGAALGSETTDGRFTYAIDLDRKDDRNGETNLGILIVERGGGIALPETLTQRTPSGGRHLLFTSSQPLPSSAGKIGPGIDTRGTGGYIVLAPGSISDAGANLAFYSLERRDCPIAELPAWFEAVALEHKGRSVAGGDGPEVRSLAVVTEALRQIDPGLAGEYEVWRNILWAVRDATLLGEDGRPVDIECKTALLQSWSRGTLEQGSPS